MTSKGQRCTGQKELPRDQVDRMGFPKWGMGGREALFF